MDTIESEKHAPFKLELTVKVEANGSFETLVTLPICALRWCKLGMAKRPHRLSKP
jgi:hypothetical protein